MMIALEGLRVVALVVFLHSVATLPDNQPNRTMIMNMTFHHSSTTADEESK
jgi:hypothetical protein